MTDHAFSALCYTQVTNNHKNYLKLQIDDIDVSRFNLPEKYVVLTSNYTSPVRKMLGSHFNEIKKYIRSKGYSVVVLGKSETKTGAHTPIFSSVDEEIDFSDTIDLRESTSVIEAAKILQRSTCVVGLDNGLLHLAAATGDVPIVYGFTTVKPEHRLPYRNDTMGHNCYPVVLTEQELSCIGCQSNMTFTYNFSFTNCFYSDYKCLSLLDNNKYVLELSKIIG